MTGRRGRASRHRAGGSVASTVGLALLAGVLLWEPGYQARWAPGEPSTPILDPGLADSWIPALVVVIAANIVLLVCVYRRGHWTVGLAFVNTVLNLAFAVLDTASSWWKAWQHSSSRGTGRVTHDG